jgi:hypothetical protein
MVVFHAAPSTLALITREPVLFGAVVPLLPLPPHAVEARRTDLAIAKRRCIDRSLRGFVPAPAYVAPTRSENRHAPREWATRAYFRT